MLKSLAKWLFLVFFAVIVGFWWCGYELPPTLIPPGDFNFSSISSRATELRNLEPKYLADVDFYLRAPANQKPPECNLVYVKVDPTYFALVDRIVGKDASPEDLAMLAIWAEQQDPWLESRNHVYSIVFYGNIGRLGKLKTMRARYALWRIRAALAQSIHLDGHLAESIVEAQDEQNDKTSN